MSNNNLLISCSYYYPNISGVSIYAKILAETMTKDYKVTVLTSAYHHTLPIELVNGVTIIRSKVLCSIGKGIVMPYFFIDGYKEVLKSEIINCHLPQLESVILAFWAKVFSKKLVVTHHCEFGFDGPFLNKVIAFLSFPAHFLTYLWANNIVAYTQDYADHSIFLRLFKNKVTIILPPVVVGKEDFDEQKKIKNKIGGGKIIGFVGRIGWEKGLNFLVEAFVEIHKKIKAKLVLVGPYENVVGDKSAKVFLNLIKNNKDIVMLGPMDHEKLINFYKICNCLVLPSTSNLETFGIVQAEAMISGCPVVASDLPGVRVPVKLTGMGEISKVKDSSDLAEKIMKVLSKNYSKMTNKAQEIFRFTKFKDSYKEIYSQK